jgi:hypothetical protein
MEFDITGVTGMYALISANGPGSAVIPGGPCAGTVSGLSPSGLAFRGAHAAPGGVGGLTPTIPGAACGAHLQALDLETCELSATVPLVGGEECPGDWQTGTLCNGADFGGGCTTEETGYHYNGVFNSGGQDYACWWHTKNQAWNTTTDTNFNALAIAHGLPELSGTSKWCFARASDPCTSGACALGPNPVSYFEAGHIGAWGWCGGAPFTSGGHVCIPVTPEIAASCGG